MTGLHLARECKTQILCHCMGGGISRMWTEMLCSAHPWKDCAVVRIAVRPEVLACIRWQVLERSSVQAGICWESLAVVLVGFGRSLLV